MRFVGGPLHGEYRYCPEFSLPDLRAVDVTPLQGVSLPIHRYPTAAVPGDPTHYRPTVVHFYRLQQHEGNGPVFLFYASQTLSVEQANRAAEQWVAGHLEDVA